jgi:hypothetical protein
VLLAQRLAPRREVLVQETAKQSLRAGAFIDKVTFQHGIWEAKDTAAELPTEVRQKVGKGYYRHEQPDGTPPSLSVPVLSHRCHCGEGLKGLRVPYAMA